MVGLFRLKLLLLFIFIWGFSLAQNSDSVRQITPNDQNLFYGNENVNLVRLFWMGGNQMIGLRYQESRPKDLVLMNENRLIIDSLSINELFLEDYRFESGKFISLINLFQTGENDLAILHGFGTTKAKISNGVFEVLEKKVRLGKPDIPPKYFEGYDFFHLENLTLGFKVNRKKWLKSADFWVYNWETGKFAEYRDSEFEEESNNTYWNTSKSPETFSTLTQFAYNVTKTRYGLLFNLPLKNRFVIYDSEKSTMQGYQFPELENKREARFVFYDWNWDRYFSALDTGKEYRIYSIDKDLKNYHLIATSENQPIEFNDGKVYFRDIIIKKGRKEYYVDHYLGDLYPEIR